MFELTFGKRDLVRLIWSFLAGALAYIGLAQADVINGTVDWKVLAFGAVTAGLVSVKNLVLKDGTTLKG